MEGSLPKSLQHIISNAEYYGPSLFLLGELATVHLMNESPMLFHGYGHAFIFKYYDQEIVFTLTVRATL